VENGLFGFWSELSFSSQDQEVNAEKLYKARLQVRLSPGLEYSELA
jgi:hypothetical protein